MNTTASERPTLPWARCLVELSRTPNRATNEQRAQGGVGRSDAIQTVGRPGQFERGRQRLVALQNLRKHLALPYTLASWSAAALCRFRPRAVVTDPIDQPFQLG